MLTGVFGAVSGVGIWFAIGLAHPGATSTLIHNFVFGWAMEWVFFLAELTAAAVYYYTRDRVPEALHLKVGWVYAAASLCTLVIINGILTFMLSPGDAWLAVAGTGAESSRFWQSFFNPTYWPSLFLHVLVCTSLAVCGRRSPPAAWMARARARSRPAWSAGAHSGCCHPSSPCSS